MDASDHFKADFSHVPDAPGRFVHLEDVDSVEFVPGLSFRPVLGERSMANFVEFEPQTVAPVHAHVEEQIVVVLDGELEFEIDGVVRTLGKGDVAIIPPWVPHGARTLGTRCLEVDFFTPPRHNLIAHARSVQGSAEDPDDAI
jgi:quercetin dioxygenase-like cupin family protein